jgi:hypothetical protein
LYASQPRYARAAPIVAMVNIACIMPEFDTLLMHQYKLMHPYSQAE